MEPLSIILLLLAHALSAHIAFTPSQPPASTVEQVEQTGTESLFKHVARSVPFWLKSFIWFTTLADCGLILATLYPSSRLSQHFTSYLGVSTSGVTPLQISPLAFLGIILAIFGSLFRHAAVRELGPMFTYELAVRQNHRLITSGPYAVVRHPGYSGVLLFVLGSVLAGSTAQGGLVREVVLPRLGWTGEPWTAYSVIGATVAFISQIGILGGLFARVPKEDAMLRREFGREWEEWACRVPYKLMPLLY